MTRQRWLNDSFMLQVWVWILLWLLWDSHGLSPLDSTWQEVWLSWHDSFTWHDKSGWLWCTGIMIMALHGSFMTWVCIRPSLHDMTWERGYRTKPTTLRVQRERVLDMSHMSIVGNGNFFVCLFCFVFSTVQHGNVKKFYEQSICT